MQRYETGQHICYAVGGYIPNDFKIHGAVLMGDIVSHTAYLMPRDFQIGFLKIVA